MSDGKKLLNDSLKSFQEANRIAMLKPRQFAKPSVMAALASAMAPSLAIVYPTPLINAALSSVGSKNIQRQLAAPCICIKSTLLHTSSVVKYKKINGGDDLKLDDEGTS